MELLPLRLSPGADLREAIVAEVAARERAAAFVLTGIGSLSGGRLRLAGSAEVLLALLPEWSFGRELDSGTGFAELVVSRRDAHGA